MTIELHASIVLAGKVEHADFTFESPGLTTVRALLEHADRHALGEDFFAQLLGSERLSFLTILHNGRRLDLPDELSAPLVDGDVVSVLTPLVGG